MAENNWLLQDGRSILVAFDAAQTADVTLPQWDSRTGFTFNAAQTAGTFTLQDGRSILVAFDAAQAEWANHAWLRGGEMIQAAEGAGFTSADLNAAGAATLALNAQALFSGMLGSAGLGTTSFSAIAFYSAQLQSTGVATDALTGIATAVAALNSTGVASSAFDAVARWIATLNAAGLGSSTIGGVAISNGVLNSAGVATDALVGQDAGAGTTIISGELNIAGVATCDLRAVDAAATTQAADVIYSAWNRTPRKDWLKTRRQTASMFIVGESQAHFDAVQVVEAALNATGLSTVDFVATFSHVVELPRALPREVALLLLAA